MSDKTTALRVNILRCGISTNVVLSGLLSVQVSCVSKKAQSSLPQPVQDSPELLLQKLLTQGGPVLPRAEAGQGLLWFPFVWSPVLSNPEKESGLTAVEMIFVKDPKLVLRNTANKAEVYVSLHEESGIENSRFQLVLKEPNKQLRFFLPRVLALSRGEYSVEGIRVEIGTQTQERGTLVNMPFVNPFQASGSKPLTIKVVEGKISTVARVAQTTYLAEAAQGLSLKTISENLDADVVPVGLVLQHFRRNSTEAESGVISGTNDFPRLRLNLTNEKGAAETLEGQSARVGFLVDAPCKAEGSVRLVWKRQNDDKEYLTQFPLKSGDEKCSDKRSFAFNFALPQGDWMLKSTMIAPDDQFQPQIQTPWLRAPSNVLADYFSMTDTSYRWTLETQKEREIRKALVVPVDSASRKFTELRLTKNVYRSGFAAKAKDVLFLGHFDIRVGESKNDRAAIWDFVLKSSFDLQRAQSLLGAESVFNAYTLEKLTTGRSNNTNIILRTAAAQEDRPSVAPVAAELQGEAKKAYAACLKQREETDPLVSLAGLLQFTVLKGSDSVNLRSQKSSSDILIENWLESCVKKKLIGFRFSRKAPVNFQGELKFGQVN